MVVWVLAVMHGPCRAADPALHQRIDQLIAVGAGGPVADRSSDAEFLRRVYLDLSGTIPTSDVARKFLSDEDPEKRTQLIDHLLNSPSYAQRMQQALTVMLLERRTGSTIKDGEWNDYVTKSFAANKPWDQFVRELIASDGHDAKTRAAIRFFVDGGRYDHHQMTQDVARIFLGMNIACSRCHDHPNVEDYKQSHYFGLYAYLLQGKVQTDKVQNKPFFVETVATGKVEFQSVFAPESKQSTGPRLLDGKETEVPTFEKGDEFAEPAKDGLPGVPKFRPRLLLSNDLTSGDNQRFLENSVNRFWFLMMGRGLVHPLDMMHGKNPASHPELLGTLAKHFVSNKFDVKHLLREISLSETYQRSSLLLADANAKDFPAESFRVARPRPLSAEQMAFSTLQATGNLQQVLGTPVLKDSKFTYKDYINGRIPLPENLTDILTLFGATFGNPAGEAEIEFRPSVKQSLFLMNEKVIMHWLQPRDGNLIGRLAKLGEDEPTVVEIYLSVLTRLPSDDERKVAVAYLKKNHDRRTAALGDLTWSLLTSAEFRLNH